MKAPFQYFGGKTFLLKSLLPLIPPHKTYVEVFGGSGALLFAKPPSDVEVYNDADEGVANLFAVLKDKQQSDRFYKIVQGVLCSRQLFMEYRDSWQDEEDMVLRAVMWYTIARQSFGGMFGAGWALSKTTPEGRRWSNAVVRIPATHNRLRQVCVENRDWRHILQKYDGERTFFYLDPPYVSSTRKDMGNYKHEMTDDDHKELISSIQSLRGDVLLSGYPSDIYDSLNWKRDEMQAVCHAVGHTKNSKILGIGAGRETQGRTEVLWRNYDTQLSLFED